MKNKKKDLNEFLNENCKCFNKGSSLEKLFVGISEACKSVSLLTANGEISGVLGNLKSTNVQGEIQKKLDVLSNDIFIECFLKNEIASALISEENQDPIINKYNSSAPYVVYFDPLDGSSNIDVNGSVGSIFSIFEYSNNSNNMLIPLTGNFQIAACYAIYGPSTMFVLSLGSGTHGFTLDANSGKFLLTHPNLSVPEATHEYSINTSNERFWDFPIARYVRECIAGASGVRDKNFNMRWTGSMVADIHRVLIRGGIFMYPKDSKKPEKAGRLRLMYEANPMAYLVEQAGGRASTGKVNLLDVVPDDYHQRISVIIGSKEEVERVERYYVENLEGKDSKYEFPLFKERSLFYKTE